MTCKNTVVHNFCVQKRELSKKERNERNKIKERLGNAGRNVRIGMHITPH